MNRVSIKWSLRRGGYIGLLCFFLIATSGYASPNRSNDHLEQQFIDCGLINIQEVAPTVMVDLVNTDFRKNYFRKDFYGALTKCYLQKEVALKLNRAQALLKERHPGYSLLILDGARPRRVQQDMYQALQNSPFKNYVANPLTGSMHNYGAAVDLIIVDQNGRELDMGLNPFRKNDLQLTFMMLQIKLGAKLSKSQSDNRDLLKQTMIGAGFYPIELEWWHFEGFKKDEIRQRYRIIE